MRGDISNAYTWETKRGLYVVEANEDLLFFRALRALRSAQVVGDLWELDERLGLGLLDGWNDTWTIVPTDEDFDRFDQGSDDSQPLHHWRDHLATAHFAFEFPADDMPRPFDEWLPEDVVEVLGGWMADEYLVKPRHVAGARAWLQRYGIRLVDEPALADVFGDEA